ncbi:MAG: molybdopterin-dependent oxidoreductase [Chloroflexi bacterium]|nr:molybdopterin-dependent oxidoreductase [Chloroflexota bacterium]
MFLRFTNATLLALLAVLTLTGLYGLMWPWPAWMFETHRAAAWALVALSPWKALISFRSLRRGVDRRFNRSVVVILSLVLAAMTVLVLGLGLAWTWRVGPERGWLWQTVISWHWYLALGLLAPLAFHVWRRWPRPKRADFASRRAALKLLGLGAAGVVGWAVAESFALARQNPAEPRRFTGSREKGSFSGLGYPVNNLIGEGKIVLDPATWRLALGGAVNNPLALTYDEVLALPTSEVTATLDCTDGWYSTQVWRGVPLTDLLKQAGLRPEAKVIALKAASGYAAYFTLAEVEEILLATHVGGKAFDHWHGFPLRAVVPSRRGWQWVKWLTEIEVL